MIKLTMGGNPAWIPVQNEPMAQPSVQRTRLRMSGALGRAMTGTVTWQCAAHLAK